MEIDYTTVLISIDEKLNEQLQLQQVIQQYQVYLLFAVGVLCGLIIIRLMRW